MHNRSLLLLSTLTFLSAAAARADTVTSSTVQASAVIYNAGSQAGVNGDGTNPQSIAVVAGSYFTFSASGLITLNSGGNYNDADGAFAAPSTSSNGGTGLISGLNAPGAGYLVGVFLSSGGPYGLSGGALDYTSTSSISALTYNPTLDQVFFIGDGLTGDGTGSAQQFYVPTGATQLYFGISDACNYNGGPSCYSDNSGTYTVIADDVPVAAVSPSATPEPSSLVLLGTGAAGLLGAMRRRLRKT